MNNFSLKQIQSVVTSPRNIFIGLLVCILTILASLQIYKQYKASLPLSTSLPSVSPSATPNIQTLISKLPVETKTFRLSYDSFSKTFRLIPKIADTQQVRNALTQWLHTNGLDISQITIIWSPLPGSLPKSRPIN